MSLVLEIFLAKKSTAQCVRIWQWRTRRLVSLAGEGATDHQGPGGQMPGEGILTFLPD